MIRSVLCVDFLFRQEYALDFLTIEDGTDRLSRNVGTELPVYAA